MGTIITRTYTGDFRKTYSFLKSIKEKRIYAVLDQYGQKGVDLLMDATPKRTGVTAASWTYKKEVSEERISLEWRNTNMADDGKTPVVI